MLNRLFKKQSNYLHGINYMSSLLLTIQILVFWNHFRISTPQVLIKKRERKTLTHLKDSSSGMEWHKTTRCLFWFAILLTISGSLKAKPTGSYFSSYKGLQKNYMVACARRSWGSGSGLLPSPSLTCTACSLTPWHPGKGRPSLSSKNTQALSISGFVMDNVHTPRAGTRVRWVRHSPQVQNLRDTKELRNLDKYYFHAILLKK